MRKPYGNTEILLMTNFNSLVAQPSLSKIKKYQKLVSSCCLRVCEIFRVGKNV